MARDAIARQFDVDKNSVVLTHQEQKGGYHPGTIIFHAKQGKSIDLEKMRESIAATRLSGGTNMSVDWLEITARGDVVADGKDLLLKVSGTGQAFVLGEDPKAKAVLLRLREALPQGAQNVRVTGHVAGWNGRFPVVLKAMAPGAAPRTSLLLTDFEVSKK
jgi:hypothetical protein